MIINKSIKEDIQNKVNQKLSETSIKISDQLHYSVGDLTTVSSLLAFKDNITLNEFQDYAKKQIHKLDHDFILEWQPVVLHKNRNSFEKKAKRLGLKNFYLWEPDKNGNPIPAKIKKVYVPVYYLLATHVDVNTLGLDLAFSPERMLSKYEARDQGVPKASDLFKRISNKEASLSPISFAITLPVYNKGITPTTETERKNHIKGYIAGVYSIDSLFNKILEKLSKENYIISIHTKNNKDQKFIQNSLNRTSLYKNTTTINVYGSIWAITLSVNKDFIKQSYTQKMYYTLLIPIIFGLFLIVFFNSLYKKNIRLKQLQDQLLKDQKTLLTQSKNAAMGEMLVNIAHQWRQPLSAISTAATGVQIQKEMNCLSDKELDSSLVAINKSAQYLSTTIDDFRDFLNPSNIKESEFNISSTISKTFHLINAQFLEKEIEVIQNIEEYKLISIENELIQVLINILNNARDVLITKKNQRKLIFTNTYRKDDISYIEILDNAGGVDESIIDRIFEPYFTTKHQSQGTGIGLYMSEEIVHKHLNGKLSVSNEIYTYEGVEYAGAKFIISIPLS